MSSGSPDISAVIINYNSAEFTLPCVDSLLTQEFAGESSVADGQVEVIVVDNASGAEDRATLDRLPEQVVRIDSDRNLGYGGAANRGFDVARGRYLLLLNPDLLILPGALSAMIETLRRDRAVAAVGPRTWMDEGRRIQHPINRLPRLSQLARTALDLRSARTIRRESLRVTRYSSRFWQATEASDIEMLSGACIMVPRATLDRVGGFDEAFPLYYEDADWCRRIGAAGGRLVYVPAAEIVHYYNMSAGKDPAAARARQVASQRVYYRKHFGVIGSRAGMWLDGWTGRRLGRVAARPPWDFEQLGDLESPPAIALPAGASAGAETEREFIAEFAGTPLFEYAAASFFRGSSFQFPPDLWLKMPPSEVFVRIIALPSFEVLTASRFRRA